MRNFVHFLLAIIASFYFLSANAGKISPQYLVGLWSLEGEESCGSNDFEFVKFFVDGTFKTGRSGKVESVGFWRLYKEDDDIDLHMVTSLGFFGEAYSDFKGSFSYLDLKALPFSIEKNKFEGVASFGGDLERFSATRCTGRGDD
jgi:hypothetical protein